MDSWHLLNASQVLAFLCGAGLITCLVKLPRSPSPAHLAAFAVMLAGAFLRELAVLIWGVEVWSGPPMLISAIGHDVQIAGALLFVRAATIGRCHEWVWIGIAAASLLFAGLLP